MEILEDMLLEADATRKIKFHGNCAIVGSKTVHFPRLGSLSEIGVRKSFKLSGESFSFGSFESRQFNRLPPPDLPP